MLCIYTYICMYVYQYKLSNIFLCRDGGGVNVHLCMWVGGPMGMSVCGDGLLNL